MSLEHLYLDASFWFESRPLMTQAGFRGETNPAGVEISVRKGEVIIIPAGVGY